MPANLPLLAHAAPAKLAAMSEQVRVSNAFYLNGEALDRVRQALQVARQQAHLAWSAGYGRHVEDRMTQIEEAISGCLAEIDDAVDADRTETEESAEAKRQHRSWFPIYRAA
jgi:hypothetical protein